MKSLLGAQLRALRAAQSRNDFAQRLGLSYTFVREMELGNRLPSDKVLLEIAASLNADHRRLLICAYCDRSPALREVLEGGGIAALMKTVSPDKNSRSR